MSNRIKDLTEKTDEIDGDELLIISDTNDDYKTKKVSINHFMGLSKVDVVDINDNPYVAFSNLDDGFSHKFVIDFLIPVIITTKSLLIQFYKSSVLQTATLYNILNTIAPVAASTPLIEGTTPVSGDCLLTTSTTSYDWLDEPLCGEINLYRPDSVNVKNTRFALNYGDKINFGSQKINIADYYDEIRFLISSGNMQTGKIKHYKYL
jgi:hypothetical protein